MNFIESFSRRVWTKSKLKQKYQLEQNLFPNYMKGDLFSEIAPIDYEASKLERIHV